MNIDIGQVIAILVGLIIGDCLYFGMKKIIGHCKKKYSDFHKKYFRKEKGQGYISDRITERSHGWQHNIKVLCQQLKKESET